jgi:transposase InsO family protein
MSCIGAYTTRWMPNGVPRVLKETIALHGKPEICNTDQGSQFTSHEFTQVLLDNAIKISMDGKGRALDNIYIERFWRSLNEDPVIKMFYPKIPVCSNMLKWEKKPLS